MNADRQLKLETERLELIPMTFSFVSGLLNKDLTVYREFDINPTEEWPNKDTMDIMPIIKEKLSALPGPDGFGAWLFIDKADRMVVGDGGFKGAPGDSHKIDIGYGIIESRQRRGYAYEAVNALIKWGFSQDNVMKITANCLIDNQPSHNLLLKLGMKEISRNHEYIYFELPNENQHETCWDWE